MIDYELLTDDQGSRLVLFSRFAGIAGLVDGLHSLGLRLLALGYGTPFLNIPMSYTYPTMDYMINHLETVGSTLQRDGLPKAFGPMVITFTGDGNVSKGAQDIFRSLPHEYVKASQLKALTLNSGRVCSYPPPPPFFSFYV